MRRALLALAIAFAASHALTGCAETRSPSQVIVIVDAEPMVRDRAQLVVARTYGAPGSFIGVPSDDLTEIPWAPEVSGWPHTIALAPRGRDSGRRFRLEVTAHETSDPDSAAFATVRVISGYVEGQTLVLRVLLQDSCIDRTCAAADQTCRDGTCTDATIDPSTLPRATDAGPGGTMDAGGEGMDGGVPMDAPPCTAALCDDGIACTEDVCGAMGCENIPRATRCGDDNPCTTDVCDPVMDCQHPPMPAGTGCASDGTFCNGVEECNDLGVCVSPGDACPGLVCDEVMDRCTGCDATHPCPPPDVVRGGCTHIDPCAPGTIPVSTTTFTCSSEGACDAEVITSSESCAPMLSAGAACGTTTCGSFGTCGGFDSTCDRDGSWSRACTDRVCMASACTSMPRTEVASCPRVTDGMPCSDTDPCTSGTTCTAGACGGGSYTCMDGGALAPCFGSPTLCDEREPCESGSCDPGSAGANANGCVFYSTGFCDDAGFYHPCEMSPSLCEGGFCTLGRCDPSDGSADANGCVFEPDPACDAGMDMCSPPDCDDFDPCTIDTCMFTPFPTCQHSWVCDDGGTMVRADAARITPPDDMGL